MFTKYKIKLDQDGLTIMQWVNSGASPSVPNFLGDNALQETIQKSKQSAAAKLASPHSSAASSPSAAGSSIETPGTGTGDFGSSIETPGTGTGDFPASGTGAPITIIGPNIFMGSPCQHVQKEKEAEL